MEVLAVLQHAQHRLGREFTKEEFLAGTVGQHMIPEDFWPEETVSTMSAYAPDYKLQQEVGFIRIQDPAWNHDHNLIH